MSGQPGAASRHWRSQRLTAIALVPLGVWFLASLLSQPSLGYAAVSGWFSRPLQAFLAALLGAALLWHSMQGVQVVIEDYVGGRLRGASILAARLLHVAAAVVLAIAILRLGRGGAP